MSRASTISSRQSSFLHGSTHAPQPSIVYDNATKLYTFIESSQSPRSGPVVPTNHHDFASARLLPLQEAKKSMQTHSFLSNSSRRSGSRQPSPPRMPIIVSQGRYMRPAFRSAPRRANLNVRLPTLAPPKYRDNSSIAIL